MRSQRAERGSGRKGHGPGRKRGRGVNLREEREWVGYARDTGCGCSWVGLLGVEVGGRGCWGLVVVGRCGYRGGRGGREKGD